MIRVLVADDHVVVRNGLKLLFEVMGDLSVAGEAASGDEVLAALQHGQFDLILLDMTMPGISGVDLIERIRAEHAKLPILVLSMRNEAHFAKRAIHAGISGYVSKGCSEDLLIAAIRKVAAGERFIDPDISEKIMFEDTEITEPALVESLSERELQIMKYFAKGMTITGIAAELDISSKSVSTYKARLMRKMNFKSNAELVIYAAEHSLKPDKPKNPG